MSTAIGNTFNKAYNKVFSKLPQSFQNRLINFEVYALPLLTVRNLTSTTISFMIFNPNTANGNANEGGYINGAPTHMVEKVNDAEAGINSISFKKSYQMNSFSDYQGPISSFQNDLNTKLSAGGHFINGINISITPKRGGKFTLTIDVRLEAINNANPIPDMSAHVVGASFVGKDAIRIVDKATDAKSSFASGITFESNDTYKVNYNNTHQNDGAIEVEVKGSSVLQQITTVNQISDFESEGDNYATMINTAIQNVPDSMDIDNLTLSVQPITKNGQTKYRLIFKADVNHNPYDGLEEVKSFTSAYLGNQAYQKVDNKNFSAYINDPRNWDYGLKAGDAFSVQYKNTPKSNSGVGQIYLAVEYGF